MDNGQLRTRGDWRLEASATWLEGKWRAKEIASSEFQISNSQVGTAKHLLSGIRGNVAGEGNWRQLTAVKFLILDFQMRMQITGRHMNGSVQDIYTFTRGFEIRRQCIQARTGKVEGHSGKGARSSEMSRRICEVTHSLQSDLELRLNDL